MPDESKQSTGKNVPDTSKKTLDQVLNSLPKPMKTIYSTEGFEPTNELPILKEEKD